MILAQLAAETTTILAGGIPDPGNGEAPPGSEGFQEILRWAAWMAFGVCVLGLIVSGGMMAIAHNRGDGGQHGSRLMWVMAGSVVIGSASAIVAGVA